VFGGGGGGGGVGGGGGGGASGSALYRRGGVQPKLASGAVSSRTLCGTRRPDACHACGVVLVTSLPITRTCVTGGRQQGGSEQSWRLARLELRQSLPSVALLGHGVA